MMCKTCGHYYARSCDDCLDGECTMNCGPAVVDVRGIFDAADAEFNLDHKNETDLERIGRRSTVRGMMVRMGLYDLWMNSRNVEVKS